MEDPGIDVKIILRWMFRKWDGGALDWIDPAQNRDRWQAFVNAVMSIGVILVRRTSSVA